jgi:phage/plasmid-associated DNA primase
MNEENNKKNVTLHLNSKLYEAYAEYCKKEGIVLSRQIEKFIQKELERNGAVKK